MGFGGEAGGAGGVPVLVPSGGVVSLGAGGIEGLPTAGAPGFSGPGPVVGAVGERLTT